MFPAVCSREVVSELDLLCLQIESYGCKYVTTMLYFDDIESFCHRQLFIIKY